MKNYWITWSEKGSKAIHEKSPTASSEPYFATCAQYLVEKCLSPKIQVTFKASISDPRFLALLDGHKMQQVGLASGSVFSGAALTVAKYTLEYSGRKGVTVTSLSLHDPVFLAPLTKSLVGVDGELITTAVMDSPSADSLFVSFKATSANVSHDLGSYLVKICSPEKIQANWDRVSYFIKAKMEDVIRNAKEGSGHRMRPDVFYALFDNAVEFSADFKGVQEAYIADDFQEAAAVIVLQKDPPGCQFTQSPYWSESLAHLAGFMVNGNPNRNPRTTFIVMGFESAQQTVVFEPGKRYLTYTRISRWEKNTAYCDMFVFERDSSKMVMQCLDLRYQELPRTTWRHILEGSHTGPKEGNTSTPSISEGIVKETKKHDVVGERGQAAPELPLAEQQTSNAQEDVVARQSGVFDLILDSIAKSTGTERSEFMEDTVIAELGVDSIMSIEILATVRNESNVDLPATFIFDYPTVSALRHAFGGEPTPPEAPPMAKFSSISSSSGVSTPKSLGPQSAPMAKSTSSLSSTGGYSEVNQTTGKEEDTKQQKEVDPKGKNASPAPTVRITLLQGRPGSDKTPLYMMADGTGSIATYIHLPTFSSKMPVYGIDSPFFRCPDRLTREVGIEGVARLIVEALVKAQPKGPLFIGGFSAGCMIAFEVSRQLGAAGRKVDGLVLIDMCCPRPTYLDEKSVNQEAKRGVDLFKAAVARDALWSTTANIQAHMSAYFLAMRFYNPPAMTDKERPTRTAVIWAKKGLIHRVAGNSELMQMIADNGIPTKPYSGYMGDPNLSPMACLVPDKRSEDLGPNGWDRYIGGDVLALSVNATHLDLPMPGTVRLLHEQIEKAFSYFSSST